MQQGISLTIDQYNTLLAAAPLIEATLNKKGIQVARPDYDAEPSAKSDNAGETKEEEAKDDEASTKEEDDDGEDEE